MGFVIKKILLFILYNGLPGESGLKEKSRSAVLNSISIISVGILIAFTSMDIIHKDYLVAVFTASAAILITFSIVVVGITKKLKIGTTSISYIAFILFSLIIVTSGEERAGYFWMMLMPLVSIFFMGIIHGTILTVVFGILSYILIFYVPNIEGVPIVARMGSRAIGAYSGISLFTIAFELIRMKAFEQLENMSLDLVERRRQTTMILNNVKQGIFLLDNNLQLSNERSSYFNELFGFVKSNQLFMDLIKDKISQRDYAAATDYLELFFNKTVNPTLLSSINPIDKVLMNFSGKDSESLGLWLEFDFERIVLKNGDIQILGLFRDITERVSLEEQLKREESESLQKMENLFQIIHVNPELMEEFLKDTDEEISAINSILKTETDNTKKSLNSIFQIIHSLKGNAMLLGLNNISNKLKDFEEYVKELQDSLPSWKDMLKLTVNLAELKHDISQIHGLIGKIISFQEIAGESVNNKKYILEETLKKALEKLGTLYNKEVILDLSGYDIDIIPEKYRRLFKDSINQFIRNTLAHGIENREERIRENKDPKGKITISVKNIEDNIELIYRDDGRGLSLDNIKKVAVEKKGYTESQIKNMTASQAVKLIFSSGFTTSESVDNLSGQGVGLGVITSHVENAGGKLNIKSSTGKFCEFRIVLHQ